MSDEVNDQNDSSIERDYAAECERLLTQTKEQSLKIEDLTQEVYSLKNRLTVTERLQADYQSELDCHQQQLLDANASNAVIILKLKEEHVFRVQDLESKIQSLENELTSLREKQVLEKDELVKTQKELKEFQNSSPVAALKVELQELMEEHEASRLACEQHQELNQILLKEKSALLEELSNTREHLEMTEEKLKICKSDMVDQSETIEELRENLAVAQNELSCLKSGPSDAASRGNSLFAEVEDKRQDMLKKCSTLSKKYNEMKKDYGAKCAEISRLNMENLQLKRKWREEAEERDNRDVWLKDNYEIRIKELLKAMNDMKKDEKPVFVNGDSKILTYAEELVEKSRKEMAQLRDEMEQRSAERLNEAKALYMARSDVLTLKAKFMSVAAENIVLKDKLKEADITDIPSHEGTLECLRRSMFPSENLVTVGTQTDPVVGNILAQEKDTECDIPSCSAAPPVSSLMSNISKPKRLIKAEMIEKLQLLNEDFNGGNQDSNGLHEADSSLSNSENLLNDLKPLNLQEGSLVVKEEQEEPLEFVVPSIIKPIGLIKAEIKEQKIQFEEVHGKEAIHEEEILMSTCSSQFESEKVPFASEEKFDGNVNSNTQNSAERIIDENDFTAQETLENIPTIPKLPAPRQSILSKVLRPSLVPIDQNLNRKVRFADSLPETNSQYSEENVKQSPPKKLVRASKPKITRRVIVSKETEFQ